MKWNKPSVVGNEFPAVPSPADQDVWSVDLQDDNFNAPLSEQRPGWCVSSKGETDNDTRADLADTAEAERRLADASDKVIPFRPSC